MKERKCSGASVLLLAVLTLMLRQTEAQSPWTWECEDGVCNRKSVDQGAALQCLSVCKMLCDPYAALWPRPTGSITAPSEVITLDPLLVTLVSSAPLPPKLTAMVSDLEVMVKDLMAKLPPASFSPEVILAGDTSAMGKAGADLRIVLQIENTDVVRPGLDVDESYEFEIVSNGDSVTATISSPTYFGAHNGVESLLQLVVWCDLEHRVVMPSSARLQDAPKYAHRGLLLDTARNYYSPASIKRTIEAMGAVKLNTFHWHITDSHSFPFVAKSKPELSQLGAYSPEQIYTPEVVSEIVEYARVRGVRVIPEFDAPAHVGEGWQWGDKDNLTVCFRAEPFTDYCFEPPCGQFNPLAEKVFPVLNGIFKDMLDVFDSDVFHLGGDEVNLNCWNTSAAVLELMEQQGYGRSEEEFLRLWSDFHHREFEQLTLANQGVKMSAILWTSHLTEKGQVDKYLNPTDYIIQVWSPRDNSLLNELLSKGYRVILSNYDVLYMDCGYGNWMDEGNNWCSPYKEWQRIYGIQLQPEVENTGMTNELAVGQVLGAEVALWSETVDEQALDGKLWPRTAALAERLWSDPAEGWRSAEMRMVHVRERLVKRGVAADSVQPQWCHQNDAKCHY